MSEADPLVRAEFPTIEVRIFRDGALLRTKLCETEDEARLVVDEWSEHPGVTCEVDDLSVRHGPGDVLAPEPPEPPDEYPTVYEQD